VKKRETQEYRVLRSAAGKWDCRDIAASLFTTAFKGKWSKFKKGNIIVKG
jgi:hypothetical protein